jgi:hypothetical protein
MQDNYVPAAMQLLDPFLEPETTYLSATFQHETENVLIERFMSAFNRAKLWQFTSRAPE